MSLLVSCTVGCNARPNMPGDFTRRIGPKRMTLEGFFNLTSRILA